MRVNDKIKVAAVFAPGQGVRPVWFEWGKERHTVRETSYLWKDRVGEATRLHFAVSDGANLFELIYDVMEQKWTLGGVEG